MRNNSIQMQTQNLDTRNREDCLNQMSITILIAIMAGTFFQNQQSIISINTINNQILNPFKPHTKQFKL